MKRVTTSTGSYSDSSPELIIPKSEMAYPVKANDQDNGNTQVTPSTNRRKQVPTKIPRIIGSGDELLDDDDGHLNFNVHDVLGKYSLLGFLGKGTFSRVARARNNETRQTCALKIVRNTPDCRRSGNREVEMLKVLRALDPNAEKLWIKMFDCFEFKGHICIALELTGCSLYDFMRENKFQPFTMSHTRQIAYQICQAVKALHDNFIVHTDLKPENICFVSSDFSYGIRSTRNTSFRQVKDPTIRIIDFGAAEFCYGTSNTYIQTRNYRSPEVLFEIGWSSPCDVWSIACIIFELYHGSVLFPAKDDDELVAFLQDVLGPMPDMYLAECDPNMVIGDKIICEKRAELKPLNKYMKMPNNDHRQLFDLLGKLFKFIPQERLSLGEALDHPFFSFCQ